MDIAQHEKSHQRAEHGQEDAGDGHMPKLAGQPLNPVLVGLL
jgi:hypothetical protein